MKIFLALLFCFAVPVFVQAQGTCGNPGVLVAESREPGPTGKLRVISYRLEKQNDKYFCLYVKMESTTNASFLIWINDDPMWANELRSGEVMIRQWPGPKVNTKVHRLFFGGGYSSFPQ